MINRCRKLLLAVSLLVIFLTLIYGGNPMDAEGKDIQPPISGPEVADYMLDPGFWVENTPGAEGQILTTGQVEEFNRKSFRKMKDKGWQEALYDLQEFPASLSREELLRIMAKYSGRDAFPAPPRYNSQGRQISTAEKEAILARTNFSEIPEQIRVVFGLLVKKQNLRAFPTETVFAPSPVQVDMDLFQLTSLTANSPVAVLHQSSDGKWSFVQNTIYRGWVKSDSIALVEDRATIFDFLNTDRFLVVIGSHVETESSLIAPEISAIKYQMGDILPLAAPGEIPDSISPENQQAQIADGSYVIKVPVRDSRGYLRVEPAVITRSSDLYQGYLPYTRANLITQAFKMLGERYGWGGMFNRRDCSRFLMDIYRSVGLVLPRDTSFQEKGAAGETLSFSGTIEEREETLNRLEAGDTLYMKGHAMLYLGRVEDKYYVIHDGSGYALHEQSGIKPVAVHGVFVMELHQLLKSGRQSYLAALTSGRKFR